MLRLHVAVLGIGGGTVGAVGVARMWKVWITMSLGYVGTVM